MTTTTAREHLTARLDELPLSTLLRTAEQLAKMPATTPPAEREAVRIASSAARAALARRTDRYALAIRPTAEGMARIVDQATLRTALVCHRLTADQWLAWYAGKQPAADYSSAGNDFRVCACRHLCLSHSSTRADFTQAEGVGNGQCGVDKCECREFRPAIERPAVAYPG